MNAWTAFLPIFCLVFGLGAAIGSFLNVVAYRLPTGLSLLYPPSRCPRCLTRLPAYENIPILGWLWLRGRCRHCHQPISVRYPLVEITTGVLFASIFGMFGFAWQTLGYWIFGSWLLALALIDWDTLILPGALTRSGLVLGLGFQALQGFFANGTASGLVAQLFQGLVGAVLGIWLFDLISLTGTLVLGQTAMGGGDGKLAAMIGAWLGWPQLLLAAFVACALGAVVGSSAIALGWIDRRQPIPFGPYLAAGALLATLWGPVILATYWQWFWPQPAFTILVIPNLR